MCQQSERMALLLHRGLRPVKTVPVKGTENGGGCDGLIESCKSRYIHSTDGQQTAAVMAHNEGTSNTRRCSGQEGVQRVPSMYFVTSCKVGTRYAALAIGPMDGWMDDASLFFCAVP